MRKLFLQTKFNTLKWVLCLVFLSSSTVSFGQVGTTISYQDQFGTITLNYLDMFNGKRRYRGNDGSANLDAYWTGSRWDLKYGVSDILYYSNVATAMNPPHFSIGSWQLGPNSGGVNLITFSGTGTTLSLPCTTPTAYALTGGGTYCTGGTGVAVGLANSETGVTYQLKNGASNVGSAVNGTIGSAIAFGNQTAAGTYTVVATRTTGSCTADMTGTASVSINTNVVATPTFTAGAANTCIGSTPTYTATATNSNSIVYSILGGTGATINASSGLVNSVTGNFTVVATASGVCGANTMANQSVTVHLPTASITGATTDCDMVSLTATGGTSYAWSGGATTNTAANTFSTSGIYTVTVTNVANCTATTSVTVTLDCSNRFITRWDLTKTGASPTDLTFGVQIGSAGATTYTWTTVPAGASGSGSIPAYASSLTISGLPANAMIEVKIDPTNFERIYTNNGSDALRLVDVSQWGNVAWTSMVFAFHGCTNLTNITATDVPNLSNINTMAYMFFGCTNLNGPSNIGTWNTATVTNLSSMFWYASAFNQDISTWNTAAVTNTSGMFYRAFAFNQNISTWNTAAVTDMSGMFSSATAFNQDISTWNTAAVTNMASTFYDADAFNQDISTWNTAAVTDMSGMFANTTVFNQDIGTWNTAAVTNMYLMFFGTNAFNQNISTLNISSVTNMGYMFYDATAFNQSLATWGSQLNTAVDLSSFLDYSLLSVSNYDATLAGFAAGGRTGRNLGAAGLKYCSATYDRNLLLRNGWSVTDAGSDCPDNIYSGSNACQSYTFNNVSGNTWHDLHGTNGIIASINPNGENLGTLTITIGDPAGATTVGSSKFLGRNINITSSAYPSGAIPSNYSLKLYYYDTEFDDYKTANNTPSATLADLSMAWASGGTGCSLADYAGTATSNGSVAKANVSEADFGLPSSGGFDGFSLAFDLNHFTVFVPTMSAAANPLPVKLLSFTGHKNSNLHRLNWATATEQNTSRFEVQASPDPAQGGETSWKTIGSVRAAGNSNTTKTYTFDNAKYQNATSFYRLKIVDFDGSFEYSNTITLLENGKAETIIAYPNPSETGIFTLSGKAFERTDAVVSNVLGQTINVVIQNNQLDLSQMPSGAYFVRIAGEHNTIRVVKL